VVKTKFHHLCTLKTFGKSTSALTGKILPTPIHATQAHKITHFGKKIVLFFTIWQHCSATPRR